ncbi:MAG: SBBP repeat-containing protein [Ignavibacteria bacterium]|nr:SBBP repeat-containing protein [Ignavibacteria bacterium]
MKYFIKSIFIFTIFVIVSTKQIYAQVTQEWVKRFSLQTDAGDTAYSIAVDGSGYVYVAGIVWRNEDDASFSYLYDYGTIKYEPDGDYYWTGQTAPGHRLYNNSPTDDGIDAAYSIVVDGSGNIYVTGRSYGSTSTSFDYATVKYNSTGEKQWASRYNGPESSDDVAVSVVLDGSGNVYVTGRSIDKNYDIATVKYNSSGTQQWVARYNGSGDDDDAAESMVIDGSANIYVTGYCTGSSTGKDYVIIIYNSSGTQQWVATYNGVGSGEDIAHTIKVDGSGNVYVTGRSKQYASTDFAYATVKYNSSGTQQWAAIYNGNGYDWDEAYSLAVDGSGNVFVTGKSEGPASFTSTYFDYATIKYNSSGSQQWEARYNGPGSDNDEAYALVIDGSSNVYITGRSKGNGTDFDYATIKYNSSGTQQWIARYDNDYNDEAYAITIDNSGNVYVTGGSYETGIEFDWATIKYSQNGDFIPQTPVTH